MIAPMSVSLWDLSETESSVLFGFSEKIDSTYQKRLVELGFSQGTKVLCLRKSTLQKTGSYQIGDSVFSLAYDIAQSIQMENK